MRRWVTLYADAGWKEGKARCGFIARGSVDPLWHQGTVGAKCSSSATAEALAVLYGLRSTHKAFSPALEEGIEGIFLRCDNLQVVTCLQHHWHSGHRSRVLRQTKGDLTKAIGDVLDFVVKHDLRLLVKHVKGHGREMDRVRRWMNDQADRLGNMRGR